MGAASLEDSKRAREDLGGALVALGDDLGGALVGDLGFLGALGVGVAMVTSQKISAVVNDDQGG